MFLKHHVSSLSDGRWHEMVNINILCQDICIHIHNMDVLSCVYQINTSLADRQTPEEGREMNGQADLKRYAHSIQMGTLLPCAETSKLCYKIQYTKGIHNSSILLLFFFYV